MSQETPQTHPGKLGVWTWLDGFAAEEAADFAKQLEDWGYSTLWIPEAVGRDPFALIGYLAARTTKLTYATGIANIYARDHITMKAIRKTVAEMLPGRFILGLGVSHPHLVSHLRGHEWQKPVPKMREYLEAVEGALYHGKEPEVEAPTVIAALRPLMMKLAGEKARGAHPYLVTPEHTKQARTILGEGPWLCPEQKVILTEDAETARKVGKTHLKVYLRAPNYQRSLAELGFDESDWTDEASDRLVDALVAWGSADKIKAHLEKHWENGANHVCIQPFKPDGTPGPDLKALEQLAP